jgi:protein arginine kinase
LDTLDWLSGCGAETDVAISSRVRLARNLSRHSFPSAAKAETLETVLKEVTSAVTTRLPNWTLLAMASLSQGQTALLRERHLISSSPVPDSRGRGFASLKAGLHSLVINEEDHLRFQTLRSGLSLDGSLDELSKIAVSMESLLGFARSPQLGYLTTCPSNLGTGLRASVLLHLPALAWFEALPEVVRKVACVGGLTLRGLHGEESPLECPFIQLSNQVTLGRSEAELVASVESVARSLIDWERAARTSLRDSLPPQLEDTVWRAWGALGHARLISSEEAVELLGLVRLGVLLDLLPNRGGAKLASRWLVGMGDAHLEGIAGQPLSARQAEAARADYLRKAFS